MDSGQQPFSGHSTGQPTGSALEASELVRENEELRAAVAGLREQVSSTTQANQYSALSAAPPTMNLMGQASLNDWILRQ